MKLNHIYKSIACGVLLAMTATSCDLDYNPVDTYSDVTEGVNKTDEKPIFNSVQDVETSMVTLHKKFRDQQEHWYVDKLLIGDAHSDNAYAGTTGAEVVPYETNSIEGSNSVLKRDWDRFLGDIAVANRIIVGCDQLKALSESERGKYQSQAKIFRAMVMFDMVRLWGNFPVITTVGGDITEDNVEELLWSEHHEPDGKPGPPEKQQEQGKPPHRIRSRYHQLPAQPKVEIICSPGPP
jgi:starch-binding outer membrane protein, SusD/RagB family